MRSGEGARLSAEAVEALRAGLFERNLLESAERLLEGGTGITFDGLLTGLFEALRAGDFVGLRRVTLAGLLDRPRVGDVAILGTAGAVFGTQSLLPFRLGLLEVVL
jgi:hypothetical protein